MDTKIVAQWATAGRPSRSWSNGRRAAAATIVRSTAAIPTSLRRIRGSRTSPWLESRTASSVCDTAWILRKTVTPLARFHHPAIERRRGEVHGEVVAELEDPALSGFYRRRRGPGCPAGVIEYVGRATGHHRRGEVAVRPRRGHLRRRGYRRHDRRAHPGVQRPPREPRDRGDAVR